MDIRAAQPADIPALLALVQDLARHHGDTPMASADSLRRDLFGPVPWAQGLVAVQGGVIGYALLLPLMRAHLGQRGMDLHHIFVAAQARGRGVGTALLAAARDVALAQGCVYLTVSTTEDNTKARGFYTSHGFHPAPPSPWRFALDLSHGPKGAPIPGA